MYRLYIVVMYTSVILIVHLLVTIQIIKDARFMYQNRTMYDRSAGPQ